MLTQARNDGAIGLVLFALPRLALADLSGGNWTGAVAHATEAVELARSTGQHGLAAMPLAQLALVAALRGDQGYDGLLAELDRVTAGQPAGILGVLMQDTRRWAQGCHAALTGEPAAALHHFEQMTQPTLTRLGRLRPVGHRRPNRSPRHRREVADRAGTVRRNRRHPARPKGCRLRAWHCLPHRGIRRRQPKNSSPLRLDPSPARTGPSNGPAPTSPTGSSCAGPAAGSMPGSSCGPPCKPSNDLGAEPWVQRAELELRASGETARKRDASTSVALTAQERQIASSVAQGLSNREVAAELFLSPRTIDFHLRNVFAKTGITSRSELARINLG